MQLLGMQTATSTHLLLSQSAALFKLIRMAFNLGMGRLPPQHVMGMVSAQARNSAAARCRRSSTLPEYNAMAPAVVISTAIESS